MHSYRIMLGPDDQEHADAIERALRESKNPALAGCHIQLKADTFRTSIEGDAAWPGEEVFRIVQETIDQEKQK